MYRLSNIGVPGLWMFRVGKLGEVDEVESPDLATGDSWASCYIIRYSVWLKLLLLNILITATLQQPQVAETCAVGSALCHSKAICVDYNPGFCCQCSTGFIGNGRNCL